MEKLCQSYKRRMKETKNAKEQEEEAKEELITHLCSTIPIQFKKDLLFYDQNDEYEEFINEIEHINYQQMTRGRCSLTYCFPGYKLRRRRDIAVTLKITANNGNKFFCSEKSKRRTFSYENRSQENKKLARIFNKRRKFYFWLTESQFQDSYSYKMKEIRKNPYTYGEVVLLKERIEKKNK